LPKNLALYMRMASIIEGIYIHHKVRFQFVKVLANLFEEEGLIKEAYIEEIKGSIKRLAKGIEASIRVAPLLKSYLETQQEHQNKPHENYNFLAGIIFASVLFLGSSLMVPYNLNLAYGGFISSAITLFASTLLKKRL